MESDFDQQRLSAFLDQALDPAQQRQTQSALKAEAGLRAELHALRRVSDAVRVHATRHALSAWRVERIRHGVIQARADDVRARTTMEAAVTSHLRATTQTRLVDVASGDLGVVAEWLSARLAFSAASPGPGQVAATLMGGRIESLEGRSTAALVYRLDDHVVDVFVLPMSSGTDAVSTSSLRGYTVSHWSHGGLRWCVVSDLPRRPLVAFVQALKRVDDAS